LLAKSWHFKHLHRTQNAANSVAVERIFPDHAPFIDSIKVIRRGDVRRAKLYYLRDRVGKSGRVREKVMSSAAEAA